MVWRLRPVKTFFISNCYMHIFHVPCIYPQVMGCCAAEPTGLGFVCFVVINLRVLSANNLFLGLFINFLVLLPPPYETIYHIILPDSWPHRATASILVAVCSENPHHKWSPLPTPEMQLWKTWLSTCLKTRPFLEWGGGEVLYFGSKKDWIFR